MPFTTLPIADVDIADLIAQPLPDASSFNALITTAEGTPSSKYYGIVCSDFPILTDYIVPENMFLIQAANGAQISQGGGGSITFEGIGLIHPLSKVAIFSGFASGDITWSGTDDDQRPTAVSTELWDTSNDSLSDRLARANAAFGTKQIRIECHPRTITGGTGVNLSANTEVYFHPGDYANTFSYTSGMHSAFGLDDNTYFHGPRTAILNEGTGTFACRFIQPVNADTDIWTPKTNIIVEGLTFKGHPSAVGDGSGSGVLLGNCQNSAIRRCHFDGLHNYATILGGAGITGKFAYNSEITDNLYTRADTQAIAIINGKNCRIAGNWMDGTRSTNGGAFIDIEPNVSYDIADDLVIENNVMIALDAYNGANTLSGIAVQSSGGVPHIKGCVVRNNVIMGPHPSTYVPSTFASRISNGIVMQGVVDGVVENNHVRWGFQSGYTFQGCRRLTFKDGGASGCLDASGFAASAKLLMCNDSKIDGIELNEVPNYDASTAVLDIEFKFPAVSSGSVITSTPYGAYRFFSFHGGLNVFFNGSTYTITNPTAVPAYIASATDINIGTDTFTKISHGYNDGDMLRYEVGGALTDVKLTGLSHGQTVFVVNKTANTFQVAATSGGAAINITAAGTGTQAFFPTGIMCDNGASGQDLAMTASVGTVTTKTFTNANVNTGADTITITAHGYQTGCIVKLTTPGTLPTFATNPITSPSIDGIAHWYVIRIDADTIQLATTLANALSSTESDITAAGSGTITVTPELETRITNNLYSNCWVPDGHKLDPIGSSQILSTRHDRFVTAVEDAARTILVSDGFILHTGTTAPRTDTLPDATTCKGKEFTIKDGEGNASTHNLTLDPVVAGQTIDGAANVVIDDDYGMMTVRSDGANYITVLPTPGAGGGSIGGSTGATDNRILRADGTGGSTVQSSAAEVDDSGNVTANKVIASGGAYDGFTVYPGYNWGVGSGSSLFSVPTSSFWQFQANFAEVFRIKADGEFGLNRTITGGGTTGNQTINKPAGTVNFAASATTLTVTNSLVTANSIVIATVLTDDTTAIIKNVVCSSGSFIIKLNAAATAETKVGFWVTN